MRSSRPALPAFLVKLRTERGMLQSELAAALGVQQSTISETETGARGLPSDRLAAWLTALGASPDQQLEALRLAKQPNDDAGSAPSPE